MKFTLIFLISVLMMTVSCNRINMELSEAAKNRIIGSSTNLPPVLDSLVNQTVAEGTPAATIDLGASGDDFDSDNDPLTYDCHFETNINGSLNLPALDCSNLPGIVNFDSSTGVFDWTPDYTASGVYEVWFTANDNAQFDREVVTFTITNTNRPPVIDVLPSPVTAYVSTPITPINVNDGSNDTDIDGTALTYSCFFETTIDGSFNGPGTACSALSGTATFDTTTGVFSWTPNLAAVGSYEIWFTANDGSLTDTEMVVFNVIDNSIANFNITGITGGADSTVDARLDFVTTPVVNWSAATGATSYDIQLFEDDGTTPVSCGQVTGITGTSHDFSACALTQGAQYRVSVTAQSYGGSYKVAQNNLYSFRLNRFPVAVDDGRYYVQAGGSISVSVLTDNLATAGNDPDTDPDGDILSITARTNGTKGTTTISGSNVNFSAPSTQSGLDTFTYTISDGKGGTSTATVSIYIVNGFTWIGAINSDWNNPGNWCGTINASKTSCLSGGTLPDSTRSVVFDDSCINCNVTINTAVDVNRFLMLSSYTGTISQNSNTIQVRNNWTQSGGTFHGGDANIVINNIFNLSGGTFRSTSAEFSIDRYHGCCYSPTEHFTVYSPAGFQHNNGTVKLKTETTNGSGHDTVGMRVNAPDVVFYNLVIDGTDSNSAGGYSQTWLLLGAGTLTVQNKYTQLDGAIITGKIKLYGDADFLCSTPEVCSDGGGDPYDRSTELEFVADFPIVQTIYIEGAAITPSITIAGTGTVNVNSTTNNMVIEGNFRQTSGVFNAPSGWIRMWSSSMSWNGNNAEGFKVLGGTFNPNGFSLSLHGYSGNTSGSALGIGTVEVPVGFFIHHFQMDMLYDNNGTYWNLGNNIINLTGDYVQSDGRLIGTATFLIDGDVIFECAGAPVCSENSSVSLSLVGSGIQTVTQYPGAGVATGLWIINKPSGSVELASSLTLNGNGQDMELQSGVINMNDYNLTIKDGTAGGNILTMGANTVINRGTNPGTIDVDTLLRDPSAIINPP